MDGAREKGDGRRQIKDDGDVFGRARLGEHIPRSLGAGHVVPAVGGRIAVEESPSR
jgi:hypothetical protein